MSRLRFAWAAAQALYLFSPLLLAACLSAIVIRFDLLARAKRPIDGGASWRGARVLGDGKTWRGVAVAIVGTIAGVALQKHAIGDHAARLAVVDYGHASPFALGVVLGAAAMAGELPNSFVKRRLGVPRGGTARGLLRPLFYAWDQVDLLTTAWPALLPWVRPSTLLVIASFLLAMIVHPLVALVGFLVHARTSAR